MTPDRRRRRIRGFLAHLTWPLRRKESTAWTDEDQVDYELEIAAWLWGTP